MGILFALFLLILCAPSFMAQGKRNREFDKEWKTLKENTYWIKKNLAEQYDLYFDPALGNLHISYYSDGSLFMDDFTGKFYPKGQYYCNCRGYMVDYSIAGPEFPRPPTK